MNTHLIFLRHGQSEWNLENRFTGWIDIDLSPQGEMEARRAGTVLSGFSFDFVHASALRRAIRTAELALEASGHPPIEIVRHEALNERHYGVLQGLNKDETRAKYGEEQVHIWRRSYDVAPPEGESLKDTAARVIPHWQNIILPHIDRGKHMLIAAHGNSLRALLMRIENISPEEIVKMEIPTGVPLHFEVKNGRFLRNGYLG